MGSQTIRVPITVKLNSFLKGELIWSSSSSVKSKIRNLTSEALADNNDDGGILGEATIMYSRKEDSWTKFLFVTMEEFDEKIAPALEIGLLRELKTAGMLEKKYLG